MQWKLAASWTLTPGFLLDGMLLLVVLAVAGSGVVAVPGGSFSYAFMQPSLFNYKKQQDNNYAYGYELPGQAHHVVTYGQDTVKGHVGYVNAYGMPVVGNYFSHPRTGFKAQIGTVPVVSVGPQAETPAAAAFEEQVNAPLLPLLKLAVDTGVAKPLGSSQYGAYEYAVSPHLAEAVGGVSSLAYRLGAIPVAAVHDVQVRPNFGDSETAFSPVLVHKETPQITLYTLEVSSQ